MPLIPIQRGAPREKRDAMDRIAQVMQMAQAGIAIPAGISQLSTQSKEREFLEQRQPLELARLKAAQEKDAAEMAQAAEMNPILRRRAEAELAQTGAQTKKLNAELAALSGNGGPVRPLTSEQTDKLSGYDSAVKQVEGLAKTFGDNKDWIGPVVGRARSFNPYDTKATKLSAASGLAAQTIGKSLEGGKLTDADVERYRGMLPTAADTPDTVQEKMNILLEYIAARQESDLKTAKSAGYNVGKFSNLTPNKVTSLTPPKSTGLIPEAIAAKPPGKGQEMEGYIFLGGDPGSPKSWRKK